MYQNIYYQKRTNNIHIWDDKVGHLQIPWKKYAYKKDPNGQVISLYGDKLTKVYQWNDEDHKHLFEADVPKETRMLVDRYTDSDDMSEGHRTMIIDIEVEVTDGFPDPATAKNPITTIAIIIFHYCYKL